MHLFRICLFKKDFFFKVHNYVIVRPYIHLGISAEAVVFEWELGVRW